MLNLTEKNQSVPIGSFWPSALGNKQISTIIVDEFGAFQAGGKDTIIQAH
jgi:hypothetical protein